MREFSEFLVTASSTMWINRIDGFSWLWYGIPRKPQSTKVSICSISKEGYLWKSLSIHSIVCESLFGYKMNKFWSLILAAYLKSVMVDQTDYRFHTCKQSNRKMKHCYHHHGCTQYDNFQFHVMCTLKNLILDNLY